uniref:Uncharacterized protein n=1 Tax=Zea mays TaxID=4577 RepID=B6UAX2_MAIZE|nr:hypothetical protein [Zea mays]
MASRLVAAAASSSSLSSASPLARLISRRGLAGAADGHGSAKVPLWKDPLLWDAEAAEMSAAPGSDEEEEETAFMAMYRWIAGV